MNELEPQEELSQKDCKICLRRSAPKDLKEGYCVDCVNNAVICLNDLLKAGWIQEEKVS